MWRRVVVGLSVVVPLVLAAVLAVMAAPQGAMARTVGAEPDAVIFGRLEAAGLPVAGQQVRLMSYRLVGNVVQETAVQTTTSGADGVYVFQDPPTPPAGDTYYVLYGPNLTNPLYVYVWLGPDVVDYQAGQSRDLGVMNIADAPLVAPPDGATVGLPVEFRWLRRAATTDSYQWTLFDQSTFDQWQSTPLGYVSAYTLTTLADLDGAQYNRPYLWLLRILDTSQLSSYGFSFGARTVTFTMASTPTVTLTPTVAPAETPTATVTAAPTATATTVPNATATVTPTTTETAAAPTATATAAASPTAAPSPTVTETAAAPTATATATATATVINTATASAATVTSTAVPPSPSVAPTATPEYRLYLPLLARQMNVGG